MSLEYKGKYASCKVMIDSIEPAAVQQIYNFLNSEAFNGSTIRIMPDVHAGAGAVIGFTATLTDKIIPNVVGVDIGCGVLSVGLGEIQIDPEELDEHIRANIPAGFSVRERVLAEARTLEDECYRISKITEQDENRVMLSLGTLGGGNHFIEVGEDARGFQWLTIHTGSRNFGLKIANYHQKRAVRTVGKGHGLEWLEGSDAQTYLEHMKFAQEYAAKNRRLIASEILALWDMKLREQTTIESVHNYIDFTRNIIRKGAISAEKNKWLIIPWNMRDGLIIGRGKGNPDWNYSAPHGAGRVMGRSQAKKTLSLERFKAEMTGIWTSCVSKDTLDESPMVYKDCDVIKEAIEPTVEIITTVKPFYNFKASDEPEKKRV